MTTQTKDAPIAVVGMWHLGCSIAASWLRLGQTVVAIELDADHPLAPNNVKEAEKLFAERRAPRPY